MAEREGSIARASKNAGPPEPDGSQNERAELRLDLCCLKQHEPAPANYDPWVVRFQPLRWDRVVKATHLTNCGYQQSCNLNLFVCDGIVLREEQVGNYPPPNDATLPDHNPRGCQKGTCYVHRMYDPARLKHPLKRAGARGDGRWQRISWDQALTEIADQLIDVLATDGPEAVILGGGTRIASASSEGMGVNSFFESLGVALPLVNAEIGDGHHGAAITMGKIAFADSGENWFHSDVILAWGGNPAFTNVPTFHYIAEARYNGARVVAISPDYNPTAIHADVWVPVNVGTDAALALAVCQVILREGLHDERFVREQTDLSLLVRTDNGKLLREADVKRGGRDDVFYFFDLTSGDIAEAPRSSLALDGRVPALHGEYLAQTNHGSIEVRPALAALRERLDTRFQPEQASDITGVPASLIQRLAREIAAARGVVNIPSYNWGKFYHGDLIERAIILIFALCGHMGRKGASYSAFPWLAVDTDVGAWERQGRRLLQTAAGADPRWSAWKEDGYTAEMIFYEYTKESVATGALASAAMLHLVHSGLLELHERHQGWDPHLRRPLGEYFSEALAKGWQVAVPPPAKEPRALFQWGGNVFRRTRATNRLLDVLLPKLKLVVTVDWRMSSTGLYSDYLLPACSWYERTSIRLGSSPQTPFTQVTVKATEPLYESSGDWAIIVRLAEKVAQRARERGVLTYEDRNGRQRRPDRVEDAVTAGGLYSADDEEGVARDVFVNGANRESMDWEQFKERGIAAFTAPGMGVTSVGNACEVVAGEPIVPLTSHVVGKQPYPTLTRRLQFYIDHDWYLELDEHLPTHKDCPKAGGDYPLQVTGGHARWSIHSDWVEDYVMLALQRGEPAMLISETDAAARGIGDGDTVEVSNDVGSFRIHTIVSPTVRPGQVIIYHGWENYQFEGWRHFKSVMPSPLNPIHLAGGYGHIRADAMTFTPGPSDRGTRVEVKKVTCPQAETPTPSWASGFHSNPRHAKFVT